MKLLNKGQKLSENYLSSVGKRINELEIGNRVQDKEIAKRHKDKTSSTKDRILGGENAKLR